MGTSIWVPGLQTHLSATKLAHRVKYRAGVLGALFLRNRFALRQYWLRHFHCTPKQWLAAERHRAAERLLGSREEMGRIAGQLFYRDGAHFCRDFKGGHQGVTPRAWRERKFWEEQE